MNCKINQRKIKIYGVWKEIIKMFKKRLVALLCGAVVVSGLAVGCGSGDDEKVVHLK